MTPEEHIEEAERIAGTFSMNPEYDMVRLRAAELHVAMAFYKKQNPPEEGRPIRQVRSSGQMHNHVKIQACTPRCLAFGTDSTNYARPVADNPQA